MFFSNRISVPYLEDSSVSSSVQVWGSRQRFRATSNVLPVPSNGEGSGEPVLQRLDAFWVNPGTWIDNDDRNGREPPMHATRLSSHGCSNRTKKSTQGRYFLHDQVSQISEDCFSPISCLVTSKCDVRGRRSEIEAKPVPGRAAPPMPSSPGRP